MSFWNTSDGHDTTKETSGEFDAGGGSLVPIPEGAQVLAMIQEAKWEEKNGDKYISLLWKVVAPEDHKDRTIFQKLWVDDLDPSVRNKDGAFDREKAEKKRDKAKRMLAAIDMNAGGGLRKNASRPTDETMTQNLALKPMVLKAMVWKVKDRDTGEIIMGNWVGAVSPRVVGQELSKGDPKSVEQPSGQQQSSGSRSLVEDDEIPF